MCPHHNWNIYWYIISLQDYLRGPIFLIHLWILLLFLFRFSFITCVFIIFVSIIIDIDCGLNFTGFEFEKAQDHWHVAWRLLEPVTFHMCHWNNRQWHRYTWLLRLKADPALLVFDTDIQLIVVIDIVRVRSWSKLLQHENFFNWFRFFSVY